MEIKDIEKYWVCDAEAKLATAKILFKSKRYVDSLFYLHLAEEKIIKGLFLNQLEKEAPWGHNLLLLVSKITSLTLTDDMKKTLGEINNFNIVARYDDYKQNFARLCTREFAKSYIKRGEDLFRWLKSNLK
jgi:HEPN domain-containing protein